MAQSSLIRSIIYALLTPAGRAAGLLRRLRVLINRWRFETLGRRCGIEAGVRFLGRPTLRFGDRVVLRRRVTIAGSGQLVIGSKTTINEDVIVTCTDRIEIGASCLIAPRAYILDVDHRFSTRESPVSEQGYESRPVVIEDDVWIGAYAVITKGVRIGKGAIVGAHSVVTTDVPEYSIAVGVPATVKAFRPK